MVVGRGVIHKAPILTKAQAEAITKARQSMYDYEIVYNFVKETLEYQHPLYTLSLETLICALYVDYTVAKTPEEEVHDFYNELDEHQKDALMRAFTIMGVYVKGVND